MVRKGCWLGKRMKGVKVVDEPTAHHGILLCSIWVNQERTVERQNQKRKSYEYYINILVVLFPLLALSTGLGCRCRHTRCPSRFAAF